MGKQVQRIIDAISASLVTAEVVSQTVHTGTTNEFLRPHSSLRDGIADICASGEPYAVHQPANARDESTIDPRISVGCLGAMP